MEWALTLNRHRLYDTWAKDSSKLQCTHRNITLGLHISNAAFDVLNSRIYHNAQTALATMFVFGTLLCTAAVVSAFEVINFLDLCNISMAFSLWCAVKVYSLVTSLLFPDVNDLDPQDKQILFLTADYLEIDQLVPFLQLYSHEVRVEYLKETAHPERLQRLLQWYHGNCRIIPEKWEDAIFAAGLSVKKLSLDDGMHLRTSFPNLVKWFPNLIELTINDQSFDMSAIEALPTLRHLKKLQVAHIAGEAVNYTKVYESLQALHWLTELEMPLGQITADILKKFAELMPDLHTLSMTDCRSELTEGHVSALKSMKQLEKLTIEGNFTWHSGKALSELQDLKGLTHLDILPRGPSNNITSLDVPALCNMPKLESVQLNHLPINNSALEKMAKHCSQLRRVALKRCHSFSSSALNSFKKLASLEDLLLESQGLDDDAIAHVANMYGLKKLSLCTPDKPLSDQALAALGRCSELRQLCLSGTNIATNGLKSISDGCKAIETLILDGSKFLESEDMMSLQTLPKLRELSVNHCPKLDNNAVKEISKIATLTSFSVTHTKVTWASWKHWSDHAALESLVMWNPPSGREVFDIVDVQLLPKQLRSLDIRSVEYLELEALIERCPHLMTIHPSNQMNIKGDYAPETIIQNFQRFSKLKRLYLNSLTLFYGRYTELAESLENLTALPGIQQVYVNERIRQIYQTLQKELPVGLKVI